MAKTKRTEEFDEANKIFGRNLQSAIDAAGIKQIELSYRIGYNSSSTMSQICAGTRGMSHIMKLRAAKELGLDISDLTSETPITPTGYRIIMAARKIATLEEGHPMLRMVEKMLLQAAKDAEPPR